MVSALYHMKRRLWKVCAHTTHELKVSQQVASALEEPTRAKHFYCAFIGALVTLDREALAVWAQGRGISGSPEHLLDHPDVRAAVEEAVEDANRAVSKAESIRKFAVIAEEWSEEGGQLTPSLKLKRSVVMRESRAHVDALYR